MCAYVCLSTDVSRLASQLTYFYSMYMPVVIYRNRVNLRVKDECKKEELSAVEKAARKRERANSYL